MSYRDSLLWQQFDIKDEHARRLVVAYDDFRNNAGKLTSLIQGTLMDLTIHDVSHLDGLWSTASLLVGENFPTNPLELFVFGGAVLLHDSALCAEAYDGLDEIRSTSIWKDTQALCIERGMSDKLKIENFCDFQAIRSLHAQQASTLATKTWTTRNQIDSVHLISDDVLRNSYGEIIGTIASSHHWNIEKLIELLPSHIGAVDGFPASWSINPVKIACMLRCADALHISSARAPLFLHALTNRMGVSHDHWQAQNWLTQATTLPTDSTGKTAVFTSTRAFDSNNDSAWWVAHDLIELADREIQSSNEVLNSLSNVHCQHFQIERIAGSGNAKELKKYVRTDGWNPSPIELRVGDVKDLVAKLGGQGLYAATDFPSQLLVVIRELIQNAQDAINSRCVFEPDAPREVLIALEEKQDCYVLSVFDTGCGMTKAVMTGPMLDFGSSFWTSDLVNSEFPNLKGSGFRSAGKYGIGFYSCFMIAESVSVISRNYKQGLEESNSLQFKEGLSLRPQLIEGKNLGSMKYSTEIRLTIEKNHDRATFEFTLGTNYTGNAASVVSLDKAVAHLAQFCGVDLYIQLEGKTTQLVDRDITKNLPPSELQKNDFIRLGGNQITSDNLKLLQTNMRHIDNANPHLGFAALFPFVSREIGYGAKTIGGLRTNLNSDNRGFIGFIDHTPDSAKRNPHEPTASIYQLESWCNEQISLLDAYQISDIDWHYLCADLPYFHVDPSPYLRVPVYLSNETLVFLTLKKLTDLLLTTPIYLIMESDIALFAEERDAMKLGLFPRICDIFSVQRTFESKPKNTLKADRSKPDYTLKALIVKSLEQIEKQLEVTSEDLNQKTTRFYSSMTKLTLRSVEKTKKLS